MSEDTLTVSSSSDTQANVGTVAAGGEAREESSLVEESLPGVSRESNSGSPAREAQAASYESPVSSRQRMLDAAEAELAEIESQPESQGEQEPAEAPQYHEQQQAQQLPAQIQIEQLRAELLPGFVQRLDAVTADLSEEQLRASAAVPLSNDPATAARLLDSFALLPGGIEAAAYVMRNPDEKRKLASLPEHMAQARVAQLSNRFDPALQRRASTAPAPIRPVSGSSTRTVVPDEMSYQEFKKYREREIKARRRQ
jgi:hypothetical protein